jgi:hypothetical protein
VSKLKVGQKLYLEKDGKIIKVEIDKVGRKYFTLKDDYSWRRLEIENLFWCDPHYGSDRIQLYLSKQEILDNNEWSEVFNMLHNFFDRYVSPNEITLDQLKRIVSIIEKK